MTRRKTHTRKPAASLLTPDTRLWITRAWREKAKRRRFDLDDLRSVFKTGFIEQDPEWDERHRNYKYRISGCDVEAHPFRIVVAVSGNTITLLSGHRRRRKK